MCKIRRFGHPPGNFIRHGRPVRFTSLHNCFHIYPRYPLRRELTSQRNCWVSIFHILLINSTQKIKSMYLYIITMNDTTTRHAPWKSSASSEDQVEDIPTNIHGKLSFLCRLSFLFLASFFLTIFLGK